MSQRNSPPRKKKGSPTRRGHPIRSQPAGSTGPEKGVFELRFNSDGTVASVLVMESSGHDLLDDTCGKTLIKWRCRPGLCAKMRFPIDFSIDGAKQ